MELVGVVSWGIIWVQAVRTLVCLASSWVDTVLSLDRIRYGGLPCQLGFPCGSSVHSSHQIDVCPEDEPTVGLTYKVAGHCQ